LANVSGALPTGGELILAAARCSIARPAWVTCRARERDLERPTPQECAIAGPAVYPINAPATAPPGPRTTAPDTAPSAALPARSWACAPNEINDAAITGATSSLFIAIPLNESRSTGLRNCGGTKEDFGSDALSISAQLIEKARDRHCRCGLNSWDDEDMPVICPTCQILF
jgi:hypothetical protein